MTPMAPVDMGSLRSPGAIRGVLFDKDGTLFDFQRTWVPVNRVAAMAVAEQDPQLAKRLLERAGQDESGRVAGGSLLAAGHTGEIAAAWADLMGLDDTSLPGLVRRIDEVFQRHGPEHAAPVTDLSSLLNDLRSRGLFLGVATSDSEHAARRMLARFVAPDMLDYIAGYDSGHGGKPKPGMVYGFCRDAGIAPAEVVVVGDNLHDIHMGKAAGCGLTVGVLSGTGERAVLAAHADVVLNSIVELPAWLAEHGHRAGP
ncbi:putative phosphatase [Salinisphaera hydrothermalis EPR70]